MTENVEKKKPRLSLAAWIINGMLAGIVCGLFFGEYCAGLEVLGEAFIKLLQMTILPYIVASLIKGFGSLSAKTAKELFLKAGLVLLAFWAVALGMLVLLPFAFPRNEAGTFFSTSMITPAREVDFLAVYIPANPFLSLSNSFVPGIVLFCISMGVALIRIENKQVLLDALETVTEALVQVAKFVVKLTPIGVFAMTASAAGTMTLDELSKLQVYFVTLAVGVLLLTFWIMPMIVALVTPIRYRDVISVSRAALLTAFATDNLFILLPILIMNCETLQEKYKLKTEETSTYVDVIVPVSFNFPNVATLLKILFIPFAGWFTGSVLSLAEYPKLSAAGILSMFGGAKLAIPFLLDLFHMPADLFQMYLVMGIINSRMGTMLSAMSLLAFTLVSTCYLTGTLRVQWQRIAQVSALTAVLLIASIIGVRTYLQNVIDRQGNTGESVMDMQLQLPMEGRSEVKELAGSLPRGVSTPEEIRRSGVIRVGFIQDGLPYTFTNRAGDLVGLDVDLVHLLADEMECQVEFYPYEPGTLAEHLNRGDFDFSVSGIAMTTPELTEMRFSTPYLQVTLALIVPDYRRHEFATMDSIRELGPIRIGVFPSSYFEQKLRQAFPEAEIVRVTSARKCFEGAEDVDALLYDAEGGAAWTLLYPGFQVTIPTDRAMRQPVAFAVARESEELSQFLSQWIQLKRDAGIIDELFDYWILGKGAQRKPPRWSIIRNVLQWVD